MFVDECGVFQTGAPPPVVAATLPTWLWGYLTMSPIVYAGSVILAACTLATTLTYIVCNRCVHHIQIL